MMNSTYAISRTQAYKPLIRALFICLCLLLPHSLTYGSEQSPDKITINNTSSFLFVYPLDQYFAADNSLPQELVHKQAASRRYKRGYLATWALRGQALYLIKLEQPYFLKGSINRQINWRAIPLHRIFPGAGEEVLADWFSGTLEISKRKRLSRQQRDSDSLTGIETRIEVRAGKVLLPPGS